MGQPQPVNNAAQTQPLDNCFFLSDTSIGVPETQASLNIPVESGIADTPITYDTNAVTATGDDDYDDVTDTATSGDGSSDTDGDGFNDTNAKIPITIMDDDDLEGNETFEVTISNVDFCFNATATVTIVDDEEPPDETPPLTTITRPEHNKTYAQSNLMKLKGTVTDDSAIAGAEIRLRKNMKNGNCKFWNGGEFSVLPCNTSLWNAVQGTNNWTYNLSKALSPSINTKTKSYTLSARASDVEGNDETILQSGRNRNTFEIKP